MAIVAYGLGIDGSTGTRVTLAELGITLDAMPDIEVVDLTVTVDIDEAITVDVDFPETTVDVD